MTDVILHPSDDARPVLADFFKRVQGATELVEVVIAAGIALEDLHGVPREPYPDVPRG
jgi:hypothetical protein